MSDPLVLASGSEIRAQILRRAGVEIEVRPARIDEEALLQSLMAEGAPPRDIADALAETKARRVADKLSGRWVLGCDQVLDLDGRILSKPADEDEARHHLSLLSGRTHNLFSAAVLFDGPTPIWRHVGQTRLTMRSLSDAFLAAYVTRNWHSIRSSVGGYKIEEEGVRLFSRIDGDHFTILGLPLIELLSFLVLRGKLAT
ncbi:Maf family protein [Palleronia sp. KMU-117]|uniref:Maf family protein n=1 Tax=Palleronia sp. KMU-117 TaxID=3434108 RepID=UPI003D746373